MKSLYKYSLLGLILTLAACQVDHVSSYENIKVFASISSDVPTRVSEDGSAFTDGDAIMVVNTSRTTNNTAVYVCNSTADVWTTNDIFLWESNVANVFHAWYPVSASYESFTIPADQTSGIEECDWMTAETTASASEGGISLMFDRHLTKVSVEIAAWGGEFDESDRIVSDLKVLTLGGVVGNDGTVSGTEEPYFVSPYVKTDSQVYSALLAPGTYAPGTEIITLQVGGKSLSVQTAEELTLLAGKAYTFKLNVGKSVIVVSAENVSVRDWDDEEILDQQFENIVYEMPDDAPTSYELSYSSTTLVVPVYSNVSSDVSVEYSGSETGWITYNGNVTKASAANEVSFNIASNKSSSVRTAKITLFSSLADKSIVLNVSQIPFTGLDDSSLDKSKYITYVEDYEYDGYGDAYDYNMYYYGTTIYSSGLASSSKVECKFALNDFTSGSFYITVGEYDDSTYPVYLNNSGLNISSRQYTWSELGVSKTSVITLTMGGTTIDVNGKTITGTPSLGRYLDGYIWSGHFHERDDGMWWKDYTFQDGARIYYAKGWDGSGRLIYIGTGELTTDGRVCWKSVYYDTYSGDQKTGKAYPRVTSSFGRGNL